MSNSAETTGDRLKLVRGNLTQSDFAAKIGVHKDLIGKYERNQSVPGGEILSRIREQFGTDINWLLTGDGQMISCSVSINKNNQNIRLWSSVIIEELARFVKKMKIELPAYEWPVVYNECMDRMEKIAPSTDDVEHLKIIAAGILIQGWDESVQRAARDR